MKEKSIIRILAIGVIVIVVLVVIGAVNASNKYKKKQEDARLNTYNNIKITSNIEGLEINKKPFQVDDLPLVVQLKDGFAESYIENAELVLKATIKYPNKTSEIFWDNVILYSDGLDIIFNDFTGAESIVFTEYTGTITTSALQEEDKKLAAELEKDKLKEDAKKTAEDKAISEDIEKNRIKKISDVGNTQTWRVYVEAGRSLEISGNAGNQLVIIISDESGTQLVSDMLWTGAYDKSYTLSNTYNGYYTVEFSYIGEYAADYTWTLAVN